MVVAVKDATEPGSSAVVAWTACAPAVSPRVHDTPDVRPSLPVCTESIETDPLPLVTANCTHRPSTPKPSAAVARATNGWSRVVPTVPDCPFPESAAIALGSGCTGTSTVSVRPVGVVTMMRALPRTEPARIVALYVVGSMPVTAAVAESSDSQLSGVPGNVVSVPKAVALSTTFSPSSRAGTGSVISTDVASAPTPT